MICSEIKTNKINELFSTSKFYNIISISLMLYNKCKTQEKIINIEYVLNEYEESLYIDVIDNKTSSGIYTYVVPFIRLMEIIDNEVDVINANEYKEFTSYFIKYLKTNKLEYPKNTVFPPKYNRI